MVIKNKFVIRSYRITFFILSSFTLFFWLGIHIMDFEFNKLNYLTTLANVASWLLIAYYIVIDGFGIKPTAKLLPTLKLSLTMCMIIVGLLFTILPRPSVTPLDSVLLHYILPSMFFMDYILFDEKGNFKWYDPLIWLATPLVYVLFTQIKGALGNNIAGTNSPYPYPILDPTPRGVGTQMPLYIAGFFVLFLCLGYVIKLLDRILKKRK